MICKLQGNESEKIINSPLKVMKASHLLSNAWRHERQLSKVTATQHQHPNRSFSLYRVELNNHRQAWKLKKVTHQLSIALVKVIANKWLAHELQLITTAISWTPSPSEVGLFTGGFSVQRLRGLFHPPSTPLWRWPRRRRRRRSNVIQPRAHGAQL